MTEAMSRILIIEPQPEIRELVERLAQRLGHEAVTDEIGHIDAVIVEPEGGDGLARATRLRSAAPGLPMICASIAPPTPQTRALSPHAHLIKPFKLQDLSRALSSALASA